MFPTIKLNIERWKYNSTFELYVSNMRAHENRLKTAAELNYIGLALTNMEQ